MWNPLPLPNNLLIAQPDWLLVMVEGSPNVHYVYRLEGWATDPIPTLTSCGKTWARNVQTSDQGELCQDCMEAEIAAGHVRRNDDERPG